jgi:uncharacterized pyridoxamine 5'-phosphate oxidase family protein
MDIDYSLLDNEIFNILGDKKVMVLATCYENLVTARSMSCIIIGKKIYFQTDTTFQKIKQMIENPNIALCIDNIQIEGIAKIKKHPFDDENYEFLNAFKENYKNSYEHYSHIKNEVVVEIKPTLITLWKYEGSQPLRDFLDIKKSKAYRVIYETK